MENAASLLPFNVSIFPSRIGTMWQYLVTYKAYRDSDGMGGVSLKSKAKKPVDLFFVGYGKKLVHK